jgi:glycosyltransferase 2 family protein
VDHAARTSSHRLAHLYRRTLGRVPINVWKNLGLYAVGFGLLAVIVYFNWNAKPGRPNDNQRALSFLAGAVEDVEAQRAGTTPGLVETFSRPVNLWPFALACLIWVVALFITFFRWYLLVRAQELPFTIRSAVRLGLVSYFFNSILPGSVGGDILKAVAVARDQSRQAVAVATVLIDRVIGLWALAWLVALAGGGFWAVGNPIVTGNEAIKVIVRATAAIVIGSTVLWRLMGLFSPDRSEAVAGRLARLPKVGHPLAELWRTGWLYRRKEKAVGIALAMTLVAHVGWVFIFHLCVSSFPEVDSATFPEHLLIVPVGMTAQALFPLPGGVGGGEAAYGWLYTLLGKAAIGGILGCLVQRVIAWGIGFIGYLAYTQIKKELPVPSQPEVAA